MIRQYFTKLYRRILYSRHALTYQPGRRSLFFSPHPDDETLGCGGTIAKKCQAGEVVIIVLMTDGSRSHRGLIEESELRKLRRNEFLAATNILGVQKKNIILLDYKDDDLASNKEHAINVVSSLINNNNPDEIFIPYYGEQPVDHYVTTEIVKSAMRVAKGSYDVYEYPIWFWMQWPYCKLKFTGFKELPREILNTIKSNARMFFDFRVCSRINGHLQIKNNALEQYKSQMTRLINDEKWLTLKDVSNGEFFECFCQENEIFHHRKFELK